jgi:hypothetical protein
VVFAIKKILNFKLIKLLYGSFEIKKKSDYIKIFFKIVYVIFTHQFLLFSIFFYFSTLEFISGEIFRINLFNRITFTIVANIVSVTMYFFFYAGLKNLGVI